MASANFISECNLSEFNELSEENRHVFEEFYWLRFLETEAKESKIFHGSKSYKKLDKMGQSIFTVTKRLRKEEENENFGFESHICWTKPCFINGIDEDSPASGCHLETGDFIIFIDKINVVSATKSEVLSLINKSDALTLEIFRRKIPMTEDIKELQPKKSLSLDIQQPSLPSRVPPPVPPRTLPCAAATLATAVKTEEVSVACTSIIPEIRKNRLISKSSTDSKKKHLTFSKDESTASGSIDSQKPCKFLTTLLQSEKEFASGLNFGYSRYVIPLSHRKDLLSSKEYDCLFKNIENIKVVIESICNRDSNDLRGVIQSYKKNITRFRENYETYFATIKLADKTMVDKTRHPDFISFIQNPTIPANQPLFHSFIHIPLDFYNSLQKNLKIILGSIIIDSQDYKDLSSVIDTLKTSYSNATTREEKKTEEVKPLLRSLESRMVFTNSCKPFKLDVPGRQFIFGGDLVRLEGNSYSIEKQCYTLLFNDIILFSTMNRDRVLFITEEPINFKSIESTFFNIPKKEKEFRLTIETNPNYKGDHSPTSHCTPDLIRKSPLRPKRRNVFLRAQSEEIKKVWQQIITQQVFNINTTILNANSHVDSAPDLMNATKNPSIQTDIVSTNAKQETESRDVAGFSRRKNYQNTFDLTSSLDKSDDDECVFLKTPQTPSCDLSDLNDKIQKSLSFSDCGGSDYIFNGFDNADLSFTNDVKECIFLQSDPFFVDES